jgi:hypothetical protein
MERHNRPNPSPNVHRDQKTVNADNPIPEVARKNVIHVASLFWSSRQRKRGLTRYNRSSLFPPVHPDRRVRVTFIDGRSPGSRVFANHRLPGFPVAF